MFNVVSFGAEKPELDSRIEGGGLQTITAGNSSTFYFSFGGDCMFNGLGFYAKDAEMGDKLTFETQYFNGTSWVRYKKSAKNWMVFPDCKTEIVLFPTYPSNGVRVAMTYESTGATDVKFAWNIYKFVDVVSVDPSQGETGEDW